MKLAEYLPENHIAVRLSGQNKIDVIKELLTLMKEQGLVNNFEKALDDVLAREGYLSTGLENGLAIPHAKTDGVSKLTIVFGQKPEGVDFESLDAKPAHLIFLVLSPRDTSGPHIQALAIISRNLKNAANREKLRLARSAAEIAGIFTAFD